jgi:hypothetical protein
MTRALDRLAALIVVWGIRALMAVGILAAVLLAIGLTDPLQRGFIAHGADWRWDAGITALHLVGYGLIALPCIPLAWWTHRRAVNRYCPPSERMPHLALSRCFLCGIALSATGVLVIWLPLYGLRGLVLCVIGAVFCSAARLNRTMPLDWPTTTDHMRVVRWELAHLLNDPDPRWSGDEITTLAEIEDFLEHADARWS